jgi:hypothetical protein
MGLLTIQLLLPSGLYREPSTLAVAAPRVKIGTIGEVVGVLAGFAKYP